MKKLCLLSFVLAMYLTISAVPAVAALSPLEREAAQQAVQQCVESLTAKTIPEIRRIAVLKLNNDDGEITDLLTIALTKTNYSVVLRDELEKVLTEHEFNIRHSDMLDASTIKKLGGFLGVDGLVIGSVEEKSADQNQAHLRLNLKLANVETGEAMWGEVALGSAGSKSLPRPVIGAIIAVCLMLFVIWLATMTRKPVGEALENRYSVKKKRLDSDLRVRNEMVRELGTAINSIRAARNNAYDLNKQALCESLKECEHSVDLLRMEINNAEYGSLPFFDSEKIETRHLNKMIDFDKTLASLMGDILHQSSEIGRTGSENEHETERTIEELNQLTKRLRDKFQERRSYLVGIA